MKAKTRFMKMYHKLPDKAKRELVINAYSNQPMTLNVCSFEVRADTKLGKKILKELGYFDEVENG